MSFFALVSLALQVAAAVRKYGPAGHKLVAAVRDLILAVESRNDAAADTAVLAVIAAVAEIERAVFAALPPKA